MSTKVCERVGDLLDYGIASSVHFNEASRRVHNEAETSSNRECPSRQVRAMMLPKSRYQGKSILQA